MPYTFSPAEIRTKVRELRDLFNASLVVACVDGRVYAVGETEEVKLFAQKKKAAEATILKRFTQAV